PKAALGRGFDDEADEEIELVWYHPLAKTRRLPLRGSREFGAVRPGDRPDECGGGHCGVDLGNQIGEVIHAALPGVVRRVNHSASRSGGRYVIIDHPGGYATYYFHLDRI